MIRGSMTDDTPPPDADKAGPAQPGAYRVLARKYRPATFDEMIGQEALVRTLTNAIHSGRVAQAFILTGVRGVGKTTTARIIARALNCVGPDGTGGPTPTPCGVCEPCRSIMAERAVDVLEMDAASRTGVDDVREIIDGVRYGPVATRYKIYIIDEVHMLSKNAFNALLKTLEEPPPHTKFIFATTEIRKVPVTVLSRCQRFDLRRIDADLLVRHFTDVAGREGVEIEPDAVAMIARAADGSARDGLSLLDQAIAQGAVADGGATITAEQVRTMLGLSDRAAVIDLFDAVMHGRAADALAQLDEMYKNGADPFAILQDLLAFAHLVTRIKLVPALSQSATIAEVERQRGDALAGALSMAVLTRAWQMLLKGIGELQAAPSPEVALEMVLIRLIHAAGLPTPDELMKAVDAKDPDGGTQSPPPPQPVLAAPAEPGPSAGAVGSGQPPSAMAPTAHAVASGATAERAEILDPAPELPDEATPGPLPVLPDDFRALVAQFETAGDPILYGHLRSSVHLVRYAPGVLEFRPEPTVPGDLASRIMRQLEAWTGRRWVVSVSGAEGEPVLEEQERAETSARNAEAAQHSVVAAILADFSGAHVIDVESLTAAMAPPTDDPDGEAVDPDELGDP